MHYQFVIWEFDIFYYLLFSSHILYEVCTTLFVIKGTKLVAIQTLLLICIKRINYL